MLCSEQFKRNYYLIMEKTKRDIIVGVKYSGYGVLNEYGEWTFIPAQVGSRQGRKKFVCGDSDYTIYTTNRKIIVHASIERGVKVSVIKSLIRIVDKLLLAFKEYDFRRILS